MTLYLNRFPVLLITHDSQELISIMSIVGQGQ